VPGNDASAKLLRPRPPIQVTTSERLPAHGSRTRAVALRELLRSVAMIAWRNLQSLATVTPKGGSAAPIENNTLVLPSPRRAPPFRRRVAPPGGRRAAKLHNAKLKLLRAAGLPLPARTGHLITQNNEHLARPAQSEASSSALALIATRNFMPFAKLAARTFLAHHPDFKVFLLLVDGGPSDAEMFTEGSVTLLSELELYDAGWYSAKFTAAEFSNALKPVFLRYLANFVDKAIYLDCDVAVFSRLTEMIELLETCSLVLVPRRVDIFNSGLINAGCLRLCYRNPLSF
jgi:hypothetical protein